jgi:RHS repeat-associated protein
MSTITIKATNVKKKGSISTRLQSAANPANSPGRAHQWAILGVLLITLLLFSGTALAQDTQTTTPRGIQAGNSYSISDIETINTTSGNLMLNIPLAKLPTGRGGLSGGLSLMYNSKLWDLHNSPISWGCGGNNNDPGCTPHQSELHTIGRAEDGGWRYAVRYELKYTFVEHPYTDDPSGSNDPCTVQKAGTWAKPALVTPDGSRHELRIQGTRATYDFYTDGSYPFGIDGTPMDGHCHVEAPNRPSSGSVLTYFTIDGTFMRLDVTVGTNPGEFTWVLYQPDSTRVSQAGAVQRIYDRNGNYIDVTGTANYNGSGHAADTMRDQFNREIAIEYNSGTDQDTVHMTGFNGAALTWLVHWKNIYVNQKYIYGFPGNTSSGNLIDRQMRVVSSIDLPSQLGQLSYSFTYNGNDSDTQNPFTASTGWGEVSSVTTPLGATATYEYKRDTPGTGLKSEQVLNNFPVTKTLTYKCEYDSACGSVAPGDNITEVWHYDYAFTTSTGAAFGWSTVTGPDGGVTRQDFHTDGEAISSPIGQPFRTTNPDGTVIERIWLQNIPAAAFNPSQNQFVNPYVKTEFTTIVNYAGSAVLTAIKDTDYDKNGNIAKVKEYGFVAASTIPRDSAGIPTGIPSGLHPVRVTAMGYYAETPDASNHTTSDDDAYYATAGGGAYPRFLQAVAWSEVRSVASGGSETAVSRVENTYDDALTTGNLTLTRAWDDHKGGSYHALTTPLTDTNSNALATAYNGYGMPTSTTDARGTVTQITYGDIYTGSSVSGLYPTKTEVAYNYSALKLTTTAQYDFYTGAVLESKDADNNIATVNEYDALARPTLTKAAYGKPEETRTAVTYDDEERRVITRSDLNVAGDGKLVKIEHVDQLGRTRLTRVLEDAATQSATAEADGIKVQTRYGFVNSGSNHYSYQITSNPYRASSATGASGETTMGWTRSLALTDGSRSEVETFSGTSLPAPLGSNSTSTGSVLTLRDANQTYVRDQADKWRMSETNGLGQLVKVTEDPTSSITGYTHTGTNLLTEYSYDTLSNLVEVRQPYTVSGINHEQNRSFTYSSLGRLLSASNPESGTIDYQYDPNGNLISKEDARGVTTTYSYDYLNRPTSRSYSDGTPTVTYAYDSSGVPYGKGRLTSVSATASSANVSTTAYTKYDATGKVLESTQLTDGLSNCTGSSATCTMSYKYNLAGALTEETYPSGRVVHHNYAADGKLAAVSGRVAANRPLKSYAQNFSHNAAGAVTGMQLGNMRWESTQFNSRMQPTQIALGTTAGDDDMLKLQYGYGTTANDGNVMSQTIKVEDVGATAGFEAVQIYTYDELNRLKSATEMNAPNGGSQSQSWKQTYLFDRFGNRRFDTTTGATTTIAGGCSTAVCNPTFDLSNNRFAGSQGYGYDSAGNVTQDAEGKQFVYDGENKQTSFGTGGSSTNGGTYVYDADGQRVKKQSGDEVTIFVYNAAGQMVAEYAATAPTEPQVNYLTTDTLGTPRINTDANGAVIARHDYMPFGEEVLTVGNRSSGVSYGEDGVRQKFTGYQRDEETGLDYAKARIFGSGFGRFTSPDPIAGSTLAPQSLNKYTYVQNNPLRFIDPTGETLIILGDDADYVVQQLQESSGYTLHRCGKGDKFKGCSGTEGQVVIDSSVKRKTGAGISDALADKITGVIGLKRSDGTNVSVKINATSNDTDGKIFLDNYSTRTIDTGDYKAAAAAKPDGGKAFVAGQLGHVLDEYSQSDLQYGEGVNHFVDKTDTPSTHADALKFEGKVFSQVEGGDSFAALERSFPDKTNPYTLYRYQGNKNTIRYLIRVNSGESRHLLNIESINRSVVPTRR